MKEDQRDLVGKSLDTEKRRNILFRYIPQYGLLIGEMSSTLREVRFRE